VTLPAALSAVARAELCAQITWAIRAAAAVAEAYGLLEQDVVSAALYAVEGAMRTHDPARGPLGPHVRRRVRGELYDAARTLGRRKRREVLLDDMEEAAAPGVEDDDLRLSRAFGVEALVVESPEEGLLLREKQEALAREVEKLPVPSRRLYVLRHHEGLTWAEIEVETGLPERTARDHDKKIRDRLAAALRPRDGFWWLRGER